MKNWKSAELNVLEIGMTQYGRNEHAKEANANKHANNGAGGRLNNTTPDPVIPNVVGDSVSTPDYTGNVLS